MLRYALAVLERLGPDAGGVAPAVLQLFQASQDDAITVRSALVLAALAVAREDVVQALAQRLTDSGEPVRRHCAQVLGRLGPGGRQALREAAASKNKADAGASGDALKATPR